MAKTKNRFELSGPVIYIIKNSVNGRVYVGSTINVTSRWTAHKVKLNSGKHSSKTMQADWRKYGASKFGVYVVEQVADSLKLHEREQAWIDEYYGKGKCYNNAARVKTARWIGYEERRSTRIAKFIQRCCNLKLSAEQAEKRLDARDHLQSQSMLATIARKKAGSNA